MLSTPLLLAGCGTAPQSNSTVQVDAPTYLVGDRWTYRGRDGFLQPLEWVETREVVSIGTEGITVRITQEGKEIDSIRTELWAAPGRVRIGALRNNDTRRFVAPLKRYNFPLAPGQSWDQRVEKDNETSHGWINRHAGVVGWEKVSTPAGTFDAIRLRVLVRDDDLHALRLPTTAWTATWYSPDVRGIVREESDASYIEYRDDARKLVSQHILLELTAFTPGGRQ